MVRFLEAVPSLKSRVALTTAYATGMRVSEVVAVEVRNTDSGRMVLRIEQGKGGKDRYVMLSAPLLGMLRAYWKLARPPRFLFPGRDESTASIIQALLGHNNLSTTARYTRVATRSAPPSTLSHLFMRF